MPTKRPPRVGAVLAAQGNAATIVIGTTANGTLVASGARELLGWSVTATTAAAGHCRLRDGNYAGAPVVAVIQFVAGGDDHEWLADQAVALNSGAIFLEVVSGTLEGEVYWA